MEMAALPLSLLVEFTPPEEPNELLEEVIIDTAIERARGRQGPLPAEAAVVSERGYKSRIVTKSPADITLVGDIIRRALWPLLAEESWVDLDQGPLDERFADLARRQPGTGVIGYSADLSNATDTVPHGVLGNLWEGLWEGLREAGWEVRSTFEELSYALVGPQSVSYPEWSRIPTLRSSSAGALMGLPLSWLSLNLLHAFVVHKCGVRADSFLIRGDDLVGFWTMDQVRAYVQHAHRVGFIVNRQKSFCSAFDKG
jgi:hypothetical protein